MTLWADGRIDFTYGRDVNRGIEEGVVGIAPGRAEGAVTLVDFSTSGVSGSGALAETFRVDDTVDLVAIARKLYRTHGDEYQQLVVFTNRPVGGLRQGYFAFELNIRNTDEGVGLGVVDHSAEFGSAGRLESFVMMESIGKYPDDLNEPALDHVSALSILAQEAGHRWLARAVFRDGETISRELLGRARVHWSFYLDSDGSHLEGNEIENLGGGQFWTGTPGVRFSPLDQYLMGYRPAEEVPSFFFVRPQGPGTSSPERPPEAGVSFTGTRKDVTIGDVIGGLGPRKPPAGPREPFRQAFIFVSVGEAPDPARVEKVERFRLAWEPFFARSMDGRGTVDTRLTP